MPNKQEDIKIDQISTVKVKCDALLITAISFEPRP